ncbi:DNA helicase PcrA [Fodinisporobacter ferrooxydans]|uniref:ATP-dependent DNA helicase n=1 Tax=Fodinisporobacter ferrooxydans TaxID=2901836 RepID=A0ABY4CTR7_9BACL|nr:DNA helicase PcrA [Alicyclobacillaceae bacterium MYW30-H2]
MLTTFENDAELLAGLNPQQREAVSHQYGPLLIMAGAGSGKTSVLTRRIAYLISKRVAPWSILAITFTNKAAKEMKERIAKLVGNVAEDIWVSTFHAMCVRILRRDIEKIGFSSTFTVLDASDQLTAIKQCMSELNIDAKKFEPRAIQTLISQAKNELQSVKKFQEQKQYANDYFGKLAGNVYEQYQKKLRMNNSLDFDDLIMKTIELFETHPDVLEFYQKKFQFIHVDEYQDTNHAQYKLIKVLAEAHYNLCVVGDSDQSIYRWRGADISNILNFERDYANATVIKLEQNYRSTKTILQAANQVIANNRSRKAKNLWSDKGQGEKIQLFRAFDEHGEAGFIAEQIADGVKSGRKYREFAILYRTNAQSRVIEELFLKAGIPYQLVGGIKFYDRKEIKDILAYLRLINNLQDDISLRRIINVPKRGIGDSTLAKVIEYAGAKGLSLFAALQEVEQIGLSSRFARLLREFCLLIRNLATMTQYLSITEITEEILKLTRYKAELQAEKTLEAESRLENIEEFLSVTKDFDQKQPGADLSAFLTDVALVSEVEQQSDETDNDRVTLMTLHSAKGLEFPVVFLVGLEEQIFPHSRAYDNPDEMEEERRLCYVGITRAEEKLYMTTCQTRTLYGQTKSNMPSRFLKECPPELIEEVKSYRLGFGNIGNARFGQTAPRSHVGAGWSAQPQETGAGTKWQTGDRVMHRKWGTGTVVNVTGSPTDQELTIAFEQPVGVRKLLANFAPISKG